MESAPTIFICYRRKDAFHEAGRLADALNLAFGKGQVYLDTSQPSGLRFREDIRDAIDKATVFIILIGPSWSEARTTSGDRRLFSLDDVVRQEIEQALRSSKRIIPVLLDAAQIPPQEHVPESIWPIRDISAFKLNSETFKHGTLALISDIKKILKSKKRKRFEYLGWLTGSIFMVSCGALVTQALIEKYLFPRHLIDPALRFPLALLILSVLAGPVLFACRRFSWPATYDAAAFVSSLCFGMSFFTVSGALLPQATDIKLSTISILIGLTSFFSAILILLRKRPKK